MHEVSCKTSKPKTSYADDDDDDDDDDNDDDDDDDDDASMPEGRFLGHLRHPGIR